MLSSRRTPGALTLLRLLGTIWVNDRTSSSVRATVHSFLAQAEYLGEIVIGLSLALLARATTLTTALTCAAFILLSAGVLVASRSPNSRLGGADA